MVGRHISDELKEMALSMSLQGLRDSEIQNLTGIGVRCIKRVRKTFRETGEVSRKPIAPGRPRTLTPIHRQVHTVLHHESFLTPTQFLCDCVDRRPDSALVELQTELREVCAVEVSVQTVARSLKREGYTMKTVRYNFFWLGQDTHTLVDLTACIGAK